MYLTWDTFGKVENIIVKKLRGRMKEGLYRDKVENKKVKGKKGRENL